MARHFLHYHSNSVSTYETLSLHLWPFIESLCQVHSLSIIVECLVAGTPQYYQGASEKQTLDSELALIITQVYTSLNDLLPAYASSEQPGNPSAADFRLLQGRRAAQQLQIVREAILNLNSLDDISNVLRDFLQLCYITVTAIAKVVNLTGEQYLCMHSFLFDQKADKLIPDNWTTFSPLLSLQICSRSNNNAFLS